MFKNVGYIPLGLIEFPNEEVEQLFYKTYEYEEIEEPNMNKIEINGIEYKLELTID